MFGFGILLMALADFMARRKNKERRRCDICRQKFDTYEAAEEHRRKAHADVVV
ncbi:hypothetical protein [Nitrososphaera viennensis]|uniref:C2H2-type domain-containing protein n=2 Tax=Nitrososphaera viennensis TaxID=1034015 RepID=A0A060HGT5_9ARCH|nr:hypothetical protein [Nitrososphaera viennensis]AIC14555.1 hypothetical protein NVIE_003630 [Nitrososphaera viennensis EN76]UVS69524.1 hypothetical protein NWT39_01760 [Nitrososphaera viennensis]